MVTLLQLLCRGFALGVALVCVLSYHSFAQESSARGVARRAYAAVVVVTTQNPSGEPVALGSGFFVRKDLIVTNYHVVSGAAKCVARIVGADVDIEILGYVAASQDLDLVLLVAATPLVEEPLPLGDSSRASTGDRVYAVGNPRGFEGTFSEGIVSAIRGPESNDLIQITAPLSPGSSGGPVLNEKGEVIGIAVASVSGGQNLNFAIPSSALVRLLSDSHSVRRLSELAAFKASARDAEQHSATFLPIPLRIAPGFTRVIETKCDGRANIVDARGEHMWTRAFDSEIVVQVLEAQEGSPSGVRVRHIRDAERIWNERTGENENTRESLENTSYIISRRRSGSDWQAKERLRPEIRDRVFIPFRWEELLSTARRVRVGQEWSPDRAAWIRFLGASPETQVDRVEGGCLFKGVQRRDGEVTELCVIDFELRWQGREGKVAVEEHRTGTILQDVASGIVVRVDYSSSYDKVWSYTEFGSTRKGRSKATQQYRFIGREAPDARVDEGEDTEAARMLDLAHNCSINGMKEQAIAKYREVIAKYPGTRYAERAGAAIRALEGE